MTAQSVPAAMLDAGVAPASAGQWGPGSTSTSSAAANMSPRGALAVADAYACIRALSDAAASLPLLAYRRTADGRLGKFRDGDGRVEQIALLHPERVIPELRAGRPVYTVLDGLGRRSEHGPEDIIHVRGMGTDGLVGLSPVRQCRVALGVAAQLAEHAARFFENDSTPRGILKLPHAGAGFGDAGDIRAEWESTRGGVANAHRIALVAGDAEFLPISMSPEDAQFLGQRELSAREVARLFRVPPWMIGAGDGGSMTYSNVEQQALAFVTYSLRPWLVLIEQAITADRDLCPPGVYVEFLVDALLRGDSHTRAEVYTAALNPQTGWMTRDEVRRLENLGPAPTPQEPSHPAHPSQPAQGAESQPPQTAVVTDGRPTQGAPA